MATQRRRLPFHPARWMRLARAAYIGLCVLALASCVPGEAWPASAATAPPQPSTNLAFASSARFRATLGRFPLTFIPNVGQTDPAVRFHARGAGHVIFFTSNEVLLALPTNDQRSPLPDARPSPVAPSLSSLVRLRFAGANPEPTVEGLKPLPGVANFFLGNDPARWHTDVPTYEAIAYRELYPGIDLIYRGSEGHLKSEFLVAPGADPGLIRLSYRGVETLQLREDGALVLRTPSGELIEAPPEIYQDVDGRRVRIEGSYRLLENGQVSFALGAYDSARPLVIDPTLIYSTFLGGNGFEEIWGVVVDNTGHIYVAGWTESSDFPTQNPFADTRNGNRDAFVAKLNPAGSALIYSTYLGGSDGDYSWRIAVDDSGQAYVVGSTKSTDFPTRNPVQPNYGGGQWDGFVAVLNPAGNELVYSTYLGGSDWDRGVGIAVDGSGRAYVAGETHSTNFPTHNPLQPAYGGGYSDAFVAAFDPAGGLVYSTYLGGSGYDEAWSIAVDGSGQAYVGGTTDSTDFPLQNPFQPIGGADGFVTVFNPAGDALVYSTYLGGSAADWINRIAVDSSGRACVTGGTYSADFPLQNPVQPNYGGNQDGFVTVFNPAGDALVYSTYLGGSDWDTGQAIAVDDTGQVYVTGGTESDDFPTVNPLQPAYGGGDADGYVAVFDPTGAPLAYSTYLGGNDRDEGLAIAVDGAGNIYIAGYTWSINFPLVNPLQPALGGGLGDAFVAKIGKGVVNNPADSGPGTLRDCLEEAVSGDRIVFDPAVFPPDSPMTITLTSGPLPDIAQGNLTIDASEAGVILDGSKLSSGAGFRITSNGNAIRGMQIRNFPDGGVEICCGAKDNTIGGDRNVGSGPLGQGNLISANGGSGVRIHGSGTMNNTVSGNFIGTDASGAAAMGNASHGVEISEGAQNNLIGGSGNTIAYNGGDGVRVDGPATTGNAITHNSIYDNEGRGIENINGGNAELAPPVLVGAVGNIVAGTAPPGSTVEIFGDDGDEARFFLGSTSADVRGHFEFVGELMGLNVSATATDGSGNTSELASPVAREAAIPDTFETNDDWTLAYPITEGEWVSRISSPIDIDFFKLPVPERGSIVTFTLTNLAEDYDLILLGPTDVPSDTPLHDIPLHDIPLHDIPLHDIPLHDIPLHDIPLHDIPLHDIPLHDIPLHDIPLHDISLHRGTQDEQVSSFSLYATDFYYVEVLGYNSAYSAEPYTLRVEVQPPAPIPPCARNLPPGTPGAVYQPFRARQTRTLIITNKQRIEQLYGSDAVDDLMASLQNFADHDTVRGLIFPVERDPFVSIAYGIWDESVCDPEAANEVAGAIKNLLNSYFFGSASFPNLTYVVIVGGDEVIPYRRVLDVVYSSNERSYRRSARVLEDSALFASLDAGYVWTDDFYVDFEPSSYLDRPLYVANYPIGRLVETPGEIIAQLNHYLASGGVLTATTSLAVGYDFLLDSSQIIANTFNAQGLVNDSLINDDWNTQDLIDIFLNTYHDINAINAHFQHWRLGPADQSGGLFQSDLIDQPDVNLAGTVNFSTGCHAGLTVCDFISTDDSASLDFAQAFGRKQAIFIGNTGFGYGDTAAPTLSEELMTSFARNLGTEAEVTVGEALVKAKQEYALNNMGFYGPYDEKVLIEATLYGPPMYRVSVPSPGAEAQGSGGAGERASKAWFASAPSYLRTSAPSELIVRSYSITPTLTPVNTPEGTYYTGDAGVQAILYRPLQPRTSLDIALPDGVGNGTVAHGALFLGGSYTDVPNFDPVIAMPVTETTRYEPQWIYTGWRPRGLARINRFRTAQGVLERLTVIVGQFLHTDIVSNRVMGIERLYDQMSYDVYYSDADDFTPPTIELVSANRGEFHRQN